MKADSTSCGSIGRASRAAILGAAWSLLAVFSSGAEPADAPPGGATAPQGTGTLGSPSATTPITGKQLNFSGVGRSGTGTLKVDGQAVAAQKMERTLPMILQWDESFDIGADTLTGVNDADYKPPFEFTGKLNKLTIKVDRPKLTPEDVKKLREGEAHAADNR